ncbi:MAG TPA: hypothetical protein VGW38_25005 [Chloroflexota bacterium]|nr:hypothetical protein [Chloroflexota bacterium]
MRLRKVLISLTLASLTFGSLTGGVSAAPNEKANCVAEVFTHFAPQGVLGEFISEFTQTIGGLGHEAGPVASSDCGAR